MKKVRCNDCGKYFSKQNHLNAHCSAAHRGRRFQCPVADCEKLYTSAFRLKGHYKEAHGKPVPNIKTMIVYRGSGALQIGEEAKDAVISDLQKRLDQQSALIKALYKQKHAK